MTFILLMVLFFVLMTLVIVGLSLGLKSTKGRYTTTFSLTNGIKFRKKGSRR